MSVLLETSVGDIVIDLHTKRCPQTSLNFLKLCKIKYYNFCCFHNVQKDFMVQTGDPTATGKGGESIFGIIHGPERRYFPAEVHRKLKHKKTGTVSMAVADDGIEGGGMSGSQFFITTADDLDYLDGKYTVFGEVAEGFDALDKINNAYVDEKGRPYKDIRIKHTIILDDPFPDPDGLQIPDESPQPTDEMLETIRIGEDESIEPELPPDEMEKIQRRKEADAQALTLEMIGDIPFAEVKPPENVLFVCKLNPVTRDEDLELIFSRFGLIMSCEIIRDKRTGDSLCYAFIEFDNQADCETAYFKMNNVLIDDRRIKVDFSQSVSKLHRDWVTLRMNRSRGGYGGSTHLEKRTKYRAGDTETSDKYDMVFDHTDDYTHEKDRRRSSVSIHSMDLHGDKNQDQISERDRDRDGDRYRDFGKGRDQDRGRDRDGDGDGDGNKDKDRYRDFGRARDRDRGWGRDMDRDRDRERDRDRDRDRERDRDKDRDRDRARDGNREDGRSRWREHERQDRAYGHRRSRSRGPHNRYDRGDGRDRDYARPGHRSRSRSRDRRRDQR